MSIWSRIKMLFNMKATAALDRVEDPREVLDYAYQQQQEFLRKVKQGLVDVSTAKYQLKHQVQKQRARIPQLEEQARRAVTADREDLARMALQRKQAVSAELVTLEGQLAEVAEEERRLIIAERQIEARIEDFRVHRDVVSARYSAAEAQVRIQEAFGGVSSELGELSLALGRAEEKTQRLLSRASALDSLIGSGALEITISGEDAIETELRRLSMAGALEDELARLKDGANLSLPAPANQPAERPERPENHVVIQKHLS